MDPRRLATMAMPWQIALLPGCVAAWLLAFGPGVTTDSNGVAPVLDRAVPSLTADVSASDKLEPAMRSADIGSSDIAVTGDLPTGVAADTTPASYALASHEVEPAAAVEPEKAIPPEPEKIVVATLTDSSETLPVEKTPVEAAVVSAPAEPGNAESASAPTVAKSAVGSDEILDECYVVEACVDRYLWALYQRTPKEDAVKEQDERKVTVKRKGKTVTVTKTFTRVVDEDFAWKDPKAAEHAGMSMMDCVIGGVDESFKLKLFHMLLAAEQAGLSPGITSAFRDDYRQSIASGLKAANDRSYHGGSFRGGYGHGLAADVVSTSGETRAQRQASSELLWKWIDTHGRDFGIGRPYLDRDPPHVAPIDGKEYADHRGGTKSQQAGGDARKRTRAAARDAHAVAKREPAKPRVRTAAR